MLVILDNYDSFVYNIYQLVSRLLPETVPCRVLRNDALTLSELQALNPQGLILSPGPGRPEDAGLCLEAARYFMGKIPVLGVCLGHQVMGQVLGAQVVPAPQVQHGKVSPIFHQDRSLFATLPNPMTVARYHSLCLDQVPPDCEPLAYSEDGCLMAFQHRQWPAVGLQFHPESIATPQGEALMAAFLAPLITTLPLERFSPCS